SPGHVEVYGGRDQEHCSRRQGEPEAVPDRRTDDRDRDQPSCEHRGHPVPSRAPVHGELSLPGVGASSGSLHSLVGSSKTARSTLFASSRPCSRLSSRVFTSIATERSSSGNSARRLTKPLTTPPWERA